MRVTRDVLHNWHGALADQRDGHALGAHAVARDTAGGVRGAQTDRQGMLGGHLAWLAPFVVPDLEAVDVKLNGLLFFRPVAQRRGDAFHHQLLLRDGLVAGIAHLSVRWTTPESRSVIERQTTGTKLLADEDAEGRVVQW